MIAKTMDDTSGCMLTVLKHRKPPINIIVLKLLYRASIIYLRLYPAGSVVLIILNLNTFNTSITLNDQALIFSRRDVYWLTLPGGPDNIMSKYAFF